MKQSFSLGLGAVLLAIWLLLWGEVTLANLLSGLAVVALVLRLIPNHEDGPALPIFRPVWALRFAARVLWSLLRANVAVALDAIRQDSKVHTGVVAIPMPGCSDGLLTLVANVLGLAPGTMPLEVTSEPPVVYVHILHLEDIDATKAEITSMAILAVRAFGTEEALAAMT